MKSVYTLLDGISQFTGSVTTAGLLLYVVILMLLLVFMKNAKSRFFFIALPVTLIASMLGILRNDVMYLILIVNIIGIVLQYKKVR